MGYLPLLADPVSVSELSGEPAPYIAYGFQKLVPNYSGALCTLRESVGNTTQAFYPLENGRFPVLQALAFQGLGNLFVVTWNDQGGGGFDVTQATNSLQPQLDLVHAALNNRPAILFGDATNFRLTESATPASIFGSGGFASCVFEYPSATGLTATGRLWGRTSTFFRAVNTGQTTPVPAFVVTATANGTWALTSAIAAGGHVIDVSYSASALGNVATIGVDGANPAQTNTQPTGTIATETGTLTAGNVSTGALGAPGYMAELIFYQVTLAADQLASLRSRQKADFGTP